MVIVIGSLRGTAFFQNLPNYWPAVPPERAGQFVSGGRVPLFQPSVSVGRAATGRSLVVGDVRSLSAAAI
jgi:hypothetical protein